MHIMYMYMQLHVHKVHVVAFIHMHNYLS